MNTFLGRGNNVCKQIDIVQFGRLVPNNFKRLLLTFNSVVNFAGPQLNSKVRLNNFHWNKIYVRIIMNWWWWCKLKIGTSLFVQITCMVPYCWTCRRTTFSTYISEWVMSSEVYRTMSKPLYIIYQISCFH